MSFVKILSLLVVSFSLIVIINCFEFSKCKVDAKYGKLNEISVSNCPEELERCPFQTDKNVSMDLTFETIQDFENAKIRILGVVAEIPVPFKLKKDQACDYGAVCPLKARENNTIHLEFPIKREYPKILVKVRVILESPNKELIICTEFPAQIV